MHPCKYESVPEHWFGLPQYSPHTVRKSYFTVFHFNHKFTVMIHCTIRVSYSFTVI